MNVGIGKPRTGRPKKGSYREGRNRKLCIRTDDETIKKLNFVCNYYGITKSDFIIEAINQEVNSIAKERFKEGMPNKYSSFF